MEAEKLKANRPHIPISHPPLVAEKCCRVTGGLVICWVGQAVPRAAGEKDKSQRYLTFSPCALGCGPLRTLFHEMGTANKKGLDLKRGADSTRPCPKLWWCQHFVFGMQIVKHTHLCIPTSPDEVLMTGFFWIKKKKGLWRQNARLSVTYYPFKSLYDNSETTVFYLYCHFSYLCWLNK